MWAMIEKLRIRLISVMAAVLSIAPRRFEPAKARDQRKKSADQPPLHDWPQARSGPGAPQFSRFVRQPGRSGDRMPTDLEIVATYPTKIEKRGYPPRRLRITICLNFAKWRVDGSRPRPCRPGRVRQAVAHAQSAARLRAGAPFRQSARHRGKPLHAL